MQAEWEEMARRNWISENQEAQNQVTVSASEKVNQTALTCWWGVLRLIRSHVLDQSVSICEKSKN